MDNFCLFFFSASEKLGALIKSSEFNNNNENNRSNTLTSINDKTITKYENISSKAISTKTTTIKSITTPKIKTTKRLVTTKKKTTVQPMKTMIKSTINKQVSLKNKNVKPSAINAIKKSKKQTTNKKPKKYNFFGLDFDPFITFNNIYNFKVKQAKNLVNYLSRNKKPYKLRLLI